MAKRVNIEDLTASPSKRLVSDDDIEEAYEIMRSSPHAALQATPLAELLVEGQEMETSCQKCIARLLASREDVIEQSEEYMNQQLAQISEAGEEQCRIETEINVFEKQFVQFNTKAAIMKKYDGALTNKLAELETKVIEIIEPYNTFYDAYCDGKKRFEAIVAENLREEEAATKIHEECAGVIVALKEKHAIALGKIDKLTEKKENFNEKREQLLMDVERMNKRTGDLQIRHEYLENELNTETQKSQSLKVKASELDDKIEELSNEYRKLCRKHGEASELVDHQHYERHELEQRYAEIKRRYDNVAILWTVRKEGDDAKNGVIKKGEKKIRKHCDIVDELTNQSKVLRQSIDKLSGKRNEFLSIIKHLRNEKERKLAKITGQVQILEEAIANEFSETSSEIISVPMFMSPIAAPLFPEHKTPARPSQTGTIQPLLKAKQVVNDVKADFDPYTQVEPSPLPSFKSFMAGKGKRK